MDQDELMSEKRGIIISAQKFSCLFVSMENSSYNEFR